MFLKNILFFNIRAVPEIGVAPSIFFLGIKVQILIRKLELFFQ